MRGGKCECLQDIVRWGAVRYGTVWLNNTKLKCNVGNDCENHVEERGAIEHHIW